MWCAEQALPRRVGALGALVGASLAILFCGSPAPLLADDEPRPRVELLFRRALTDWVKGDERAPGRYAAVQAEVIQSRYDDPITVHSWLGQIPENGVGERRPRGMTCLRDTEAHTTELLRRRSPETLPAVVAFHVEVIRYLAAAPPRPWLYLTTPRGVDGPLDELEEHVDPRTMADLRVMVAGHAFTVGTHEALQMARLSEMVLEDLERALGHREDHVGALYWKAFVHEKLGETRKVRSLLGDLLENRPDAADARLRYALNELRRGDEEEGEALLRELTEDLAERPEKAGVRALAFQEWARSVASRGDEPAAREIVRRGARAVPANERLQLQLAYYERSSDPELSLDIARRLADDLRGRAADRHSPRAVYELPDPELAAPPFARMAERVRASQQVLKEALAGLSDDDLARTSWVKCRGW